MQNFTEKFLPHLIILGILFFVPSHIAIYIFIALYIYGIYIQTQKEKKEAEEKKNKHKTPWWQVLGTSKTASVKECARVRKLLSKIYHPDAGEAPNADAMQRINNAFEERAKMNENLSVNEGQIH